MHSNRAGLCRYAGDTAALARDRRTSVKAAVKSQERLNRKLSKRGKVRVHQEAQGIVGTTGTWAQMSGFMHMRVAGSTAWGKRCWFVLGANDYGFSFLYVCNPPRPLCRPCCLALFCCLGCPLVAPTTLGELSVCGGRLLLPWYGGGHASTRVRHRDSPKLSSAAAARHGE